MHFDLERDPLMDPSIAETTEKARLELNENPDMLHQDIQQVQDTPSISIRLHQIHS
jgi:hypothetical protein